MINAMSRWDYDKRVSYHVVPKTPIKNTINAVRYAMVMRAVPSL